MHRRLDAFCLHFSFAPRHSQARLLSVIVCLRKTLANATNFPHVIVMNRPARFPHDRGPRFRIITAAMFALALAACGRSSSDMREWQASDHDQPIGQQGQQGQQVPARPSSSSQSGPDKSLVELAWARNCASCHGLVGRGDGPQGPMVRAPDLTRGDWQGQVTDEQISDVIRKGRNRMPAFENLPPQVITGLVARIRENRAR